MPAKNRIKTYVDGGYYHLYNRGHNKQKIFLDEQDYGVFLSYLKEYLEPKDEKALQDIMGNENASWREKDHAKKLLRMNNFSENMTLLSYCLMPNHYHFLIHQSEENTVDVFMNSLGTRYTMYFNKKYKHIGSLFQGVYKAVLVENEEQFLYLTRYIHRNPIILLASLAPTAERSYTPSSYPEYLGIRKTKWVHPETVLAYFSNRNGMTYESFAEQKDDEISQKIIYENAIDI